MMLTTVEMAQRLEEADVLHLTRQVEACSQLFPGQDISALSVGGGVAAFTTPLFGRKLNHIVGFGVGGTVSSEELAAIEESYSNSGIDTEIDLCPHADASTLRVLSAHGYTVNGFINNYVRILTDNDLVGAGSLETSRIKISRVISERLHEFPDISLAGYRDGGRPELLLKTLARIAASRADTRIYLATIDGKIAGSAGLALIETSKGGVAHLYIDSTLPEHRGRGVQAALLRARLSDARRAGFDIASSGARSANISSRNIERAGFCLAYTKVTFAKKCE
jgi:GNAT superfamily N-acetyltransferase